MTLLSRLEKLEQEQTPPARGYVIRMDEGETNDQAIAAAGISPRDDDMVILVARFGRDGEPTPRLVSEFAVQS